MGWLYKSIANNQQLLDSALDDLRQTLQKKREKEAWDNFLNQQFNPAYQDVENVYEGNVIKGKDIPNNITPTPSKVKQLTDLPTPEQEFQSMRSGTFGQQQPVPTRPELPAGDPALKPITMDEANRQAGSKVLELLKQTMPMQDLPPEKVNQGVTLLQQLMQNQQPPKQTVKSFNMTDDVYQIDSSGNMTLVKEGRSRNPRQQDLWKKRGEGVQNGKKYATMENIETGETRQIELGEKEKTGTTVNVDTGTNDYNYSNLYSNVQEGIKEIDKIKEVSLEDLEKDDKGNYKYFPPGKKEAIFFKDQNEFNQYKEQAKKKYANDAVQLMNERGLDGPDDRTPVKYIRAQMDKGYTYKEALDAFKKNNPDFSSKDVELMESYFELMTK